MYCKNCGKEIRDKAVICVHCSAPTGNTLRGGRSDNVTDPPFIETILCLLFPIFGMLLYAIDRKRGSESAKIYLYLSVIPVAIAALLAILSDVSHNEVISDIINIIKNFYSMVGC